MYSNLNLAQSTASGADVVLFTVLIVVAIVAYAGYNAFKKHGFRPREVATTLSPDNLRGIFANSVAGHGWSIVDTGNPMIAQSTLLAGIRQQIALQVFERNGRTHARLEVIRYSKKVLGGATKAYTLRWRMSAFITQVQQADARATVAG